MRSPFSVDQISTYILAGGASSRFGEDKASFLVDEMPLIEHVRANFQSLGEVQAVVKKGKKIEGLGCIYDTRGDGPLSGIHAALSDSNTDWVLVVPCDTLEFQLDWLNAFNNFNSKAIAFHGEKWFPLFSAFHKEAIPIIEKNLDEKRYAIWNTLDDLNAKKIPTPEGWDGMHRIDYKEDLQ